jgi:EpsD family peptidyl-prolyl cis-trans isomerase
MKLKIARSIAPLACVALAACHIPGMKDNKAPAGQVVATVDGEEITSTELRAEMAGVPPQATPAANKAVEQAALQQIVVRKLLAHAAHDQGLDKTPEYAVMKLKANESLAAQALQRKMASTVLTASRGDAEAFVSSHPSMFAQRKVLTVDQLLMPRPKTPAELKDLEPLHSMDAIEGYLKGKGIGYQKKIATVDTMGADPALVAQLDKLPPGEPFLIPQGDNVIVNQIKDSKIAPVTGDDAVKVAMVAVRNQKIQTAVATGMNNLIATKASSIKYNDAYKPDKPLHIPVPGEAPPAGAAPAAPATAPAAPAKP